MSKFPAVVWALGFPLLLSVGDYLHTLEGAKAPEWSHDATTGFLIIWALGIALFWPWKKHDN